MKQWTIGLTGGLASGKSTVGRFLREDGFAIVDTDVVGHELLEGRESAVVQALVGAFGTSILIDDGVSRPALAQRVFGDSSAKATLEAILHPAIEKTTWERIGQLHGEGQEVVVVEVPLLVEVGWDARMDKVLVVDCPEAVQISRYVERTGDILENALKRMNAQASREERLRVADFVIDNSQGMDHLRNEVRRASAWLRSLNNDREKQTCR